MRKEWKQGMMSVVLELTGIERIGDSRGGVAAENLLADYGWKDSTWRNRVSQLRKWLLFCDEEGRNALPAGEG